MNSLLTALRQGGDMVVPPNRPFGIFFGLAILGMTGVLGLVSISASSTDEWSEYLTYGTVLTVFSWILLLLASTRVDGAGDQLKIVNFFTTISVPASRVRGVDALNGLVVVLDDERRIECVAYGSSVLQDFIPVLRPDRHVARLEEWVSAHGGGPGEGGRQVCTSGRGRARMCGAHSSAVAGVDDLHDSDPCGRGPVACTVSGTDAVRVPAARWP